MTQHLPPLSETIVIAYHPATALHDFGRIFIGRENRGHLMTIARRANTAYTIVFDHTVNDLKKILSDSPNDAYIETNNIAGARKASDRQLDANKDRVFIVNGLTRVVKLFESFYHHLGMKVTDSLRGSIYMMVQNIGNVEKDRSEAFRTPLCITDNHLVRTASGRIGGNLIDDYRLEITHIPSARRSTIYANGMMHIDVMEDRVTSVMNLPIIELSPNQIDKLAKRGLLYKGADRSHQFLSNRQGVSELIDTVSLIKGQEYYPRDIYEWVEYVSTAKQAMSITYSVVTEMVEIKEP